MTLTVLTVVQVLLAIAMIAIILVQRGPGAAAGSGFGAGASATVFGSRGSGSFLTRSTAVLATVFFALSLLMAVIVSNTIDVDAEVDLGVMAQDAPAATEQSDAPAGPAMDSTEASDVPTLPMTGEIEALGDLPSMPVEDEAASSEDEDEGGS